MLWAHRYWLLHCMMLSSVCDNQYVSFNKWIFNSISFARIIFTCMYMCLCISMCLWLWCLWECMPHNACTFPRRPEENIASAELELWKVLSHLTCLLKTKLGFWKNTKPSYHLSSPLTANRTLVLSLACNCTNTLLLCFQSDVFSHL